MLGAEQLLGAVDRELLGDVDVLATAVVALARVALGVLVGEHRALGLEHRHRDEVLRGDHLERVLLALELESQHLGDLGSTSASGRLKKSGGRSALTRRDDSNRIGAVIGRGVTADDHREVARRPPDGGVEPRLLKPAQLIGQRAGPVEPGRQRRRRLGRDRRARPHRPARTAHPGAAPSARARTGRPSRRRRGGGRTGRSPPGRTGPRGAAPRSAPTRRSTRPAGSASRATSSISALASTPTRNASRVRVEQPPAVSPVPVPSSSTLPSAGPRRLGQLTLQPRIARHLRA